MFLFALNLNASRRLVFGELNYPHIVSVSGDEWHHDMATCVRKSADGKARQRGGPASSSRARPQVEVGKENCPAVSKAVRAVPAGSRCRCGIAVWPHPSLRAPLAKSTPGPWLGCWFLSQAPGDGVRGGRRRHHYRHRGGSIRVGSLDVNRGRRRQGPSLIRAKC
jgi:hypothetical protein